MTLAGDVAAALRDVPDFPRPGVLFKDFTPLLADPALSARVVEEVAGRHRGRVDAVAGIEARGFILGAMVAAALGVGFVPVRKTGKLPAAVHRVDYRLEYGTAAVEVHTDAVAPGQRVVVVDDVLATGGTAAAACELVERCGGEVRAVEVVLELAALSGRQQLAGRKLNAVLSQ